MALDGSELTVDYSIDTIFPDLSIDRDVIHWERYLHKLTPVERHGGMWFKREDKFAPLGYGGLNGSKLRQCIYLLNRYAGETDRGEVISASSVKSPQISMSTAVARHYGMPTTHIIGATNPRSALKHENVAIAARLGAQFRIQKVAYNPVLQRSLDRLAYERPGAFRMEYGISVPDSASDEEIASFHMVGAAQVRNLPPVRDLIIPAGSCVSTVSILTGLALYLPPIFAVHLIGIGPSRVAWIEQRLEKIERWLDLRIRDLFYRHYPAQYRRVADTANLTARSNAYHLFYEDLHGTGVVDYQQEVPWEYEGIQFHPTYEGKVMRHLNQHHQNLMVSGQSCLWIVGSRPSWAAMDKHLPFMMTPDELVTA
jgi:1-aminocyclopropane-1-carboxylate deaminase/D-cysteine desulfhydrase-like pyridoxal-dependent ACC family enzyme